MSRDGIKVALLRIPGVLFVALPGTDLDIYPFVVANKDVSDDDIAEAIFWAKSGGVGTIGLQTSIVKDSNDFEYSVSFTRVDVYRGQP
jgi:hypothetical protein